MRVLVVTTQVPFVRGGAEVLADSLLNALLAEGHETEIVRIVYKWFPPERIPEQMLACRLLDLTEVPGGPVDRVIGLKFPAYLVRHPHKVVWLLHQHRQAYELWGSPFSELSQCPHGTHVRDAICQADRLLAEEARSLFTISGVVSRRLWEYNRIASTPLYHPPAHAEQFFCAPADDYLFFPSRLSRPKRQELVLQALTHTRQRVRIHFAGQPDEAGHDADLAALASRLGVADRVTWRGLVSEEDKRHGYAHARGVVFPPFQEDLGYVILEAMLAAKPVVTCLDSGGPLEFVAHEQTGLVAEPTPEGLAAALDRLWADPAQAAEWGRQGRRRYDALEISWPQVVRRLLA
jgi:glycosyltransferase involved in cell wall biosynthesis